MPVFYTIKLFTELCAFSVAIFLALKRQYSTVLFQFTTNLERFEIANLFPSIDEAY